MSIMYIGTINRLIWRLMAGVAEILANKHGGNSTQWLVKMQKTDFFMLLSDRNTGLLGGQEFLSEIRASIKKESGIGYQVRKRHNENKQVRV